MKKNYPKNAVFCFTTTIKIFFFICLMLVATTSFGQVVVKTFTPSNAASPFNVPAGVTSITVQVWGAGGAGGGSNERVKGGRGGGAGGYSYGVITVYEDQVIPFLVGSGGVGSTGDGLSGENSSFFTLTAYGGAGGAQNQGLIPAGGGGTATGGSISNVQGGNGSGGTIVRGGNGGSASNGGTGGDGRMNNDGNPGVVRGGGGGGGHTGNNGGPNNKEGGDGGNGQIEISYTCPIYSLTSTVIASPVCKDGKATVILNGSTASLPIGTYAVTYNQTSPTQTAVIKTVTVTTAGTGSFLTEDLGTIGTTNITVTKLVSGSCSSVINTNNTASVVVVGNPTVYSLTGGDSYCSGGLGVPIGLANSQSGVNYQLKNGPSNVGSEVLGTGAAISFGLQTVEGNYTVIATNIGCTSNMTGSATVRVKVLPTAGLTSNDADNTFCSGKSVTFTATGGTNYNFKVAGSSVQNSTTATYTTSTLTNEQIVTVDVTNDSGCVATSTGITNTVNALPTAGLTSNDADNTFCLSTSVTFTATGGTNYNFKVAGSSVQNSRTATYTTSTLTNGQIVTVDVTNDSGCVATSTGITNTVKDLPTAGLMSNDADNTFCSGTSVTFTATGGTNYNFKVAGSSVQNSTTTTYITSTLTNGQIVTVDVTNASGCVATSTGITNTVNDLPTVGLTNNDADNTFCIGTLVTFTATGGTNYNFKVADSSVQNSTTATYTTSTLTNGQIVTVDVTNALGCVATSTGITNTVKALPTPGLTSNDADNTFCTGTSVTFTATGGTNYDFKVAGTSVQKGSAATYTTTTLTNSQIVTVDVTNASGCVATSTGITNTVNALSTVGLTSNDVDNTFCTGTSVTFTATGGTNYDFKVAGTSVQKGSAATYTTTALTNLQIVTVDVTNASGCVATSTGITNTVNALPTITAPATGTTCSGISYSSGAITFTGTTFDWSRSTVAGISNAAGTGTGVAKATGVTETLINITSAVVNVKYILIPKSALGCSGSPYNIIVKVNPIIATPKVDKTTQPDCKVPKGSVVLSNLPAGNWTVNPGNHRGNTATANIIDLSPGTYNFTVTNDSGCISDAINDVIIEPAKTNTWNGAKWSDGVPTISDNIIFSGDYPLAGSTADEIVACSCKVSGATSVLITKGSTLKVKYGVDVQSTGSLTFENTASLVQIDDNAVNSGNIIYKRTTGAIIDTDYVYWSTPVTGAALSAIQTGTLYYSFNAAANSWVRQSASSKMLDGLGYIVRGAGTGSGNGTPFSKTASFIGKPNNGVKNVVISADRSNLIGNPYPSAIDADAFIIKNAEVLSGSLYFWTHKTAIQLATNISNGTAGSGNLAYTSDDYATYNLTGGTGTSVTKGTGAFSVSGGLTPSGQIAAGQAFFATASSAGGTASFNNSMRISGGKEGVDNSQFFKLKSKESSSIEKNRVWLNLTNIQGAFKQTLIGYVTGATNNYESAYDGKSLNANAFIDFYSVQNNSKYAIQGRALPFDDNDVVPLGFKSTIAGEFKIGIDQVDGLLSSKKILIEDKLLGKVQDLSKASYDFSTEKGTFDDRFVLSYANRTLEVTDNIDEKKFGVLIYNKNKDIVIESSEEVIDKVLIYDFIGKQVYRNTNINETDLKVSDLILINNQALIVKVILQNGETITKKIIL